MPQNNIFLVEDIFSIAGMGTVVAGALMGGQLKSGMKAIINGKTAIIGSIEQYNKQIDEVTIVGSKVGIMLKNVEKSDITTETISFS